MNEKICWAFSIAIHGTLLLGAAIGGIEYFEFGDDEGTGFSCRLTVPAPKIETIERPKDQFGGRIPPADRAPIVQAYAPGEAFGDRFGIEEEDRVWVCCVCGCGGAATSLTVWPGDIKGYFDRKLAMATSRRGVPRLRTHARHCPFRDTGIESDCTCGLIPPKS
jgi:hypothetical protein